MAAGSNELRRWAQRVILAGLIGVPVVFNPRSGDIFGVAKLAVLIAMVCGAGALWVIAGGRRREAGPAVPTLARPVGAFVAVVAVATALSVSRVDSLIGSYTRNGGLLATVLYAALALLVVGLWRHEPERLDDVLVALVIACGLSSLYLLLQVAGIDFVTWREPSGIVATYHAGPLGNSDFAGGFLGGCLPYIAVAAGAARVAGGGWRQWRPWAFGLVGVLSLAATVASKSRAGILAAVVGLVVVGVLNRRAVPVRQQRIAAAVFVVVLAAGAVFVVATRSRQSGLNRTDLARTSSLSIRGREWTAALKVFARRPVLGTGPDTFEYGFARYRPQADADQLGLQVADKPHNVFLEHASDTGIVGLGAYLAILVLAIGWARRSLRTATGTTRLLLSAFVAGLAAYACDAFFSIDVTPVAMLGWLAIGGIAAIADPAVVADRESAAAAAGGRGKGGRRAAAAPRGGGGTRGSAASMPNPARTAAAAVLVIAGAFVCWVFVAADWQAGAAARRDGEAAISTWSDAIATNPLEGAYRLGAASAAERAGAVLPGPPGDPDRHRLLQLAVDRYDQAKQLQPPSLFAVLGLARSTTLLGQSGDAASFDVADRWWHRAMALDPRDWEEHVAYGLMLNSWSNARQGDVALRRRAAGELEAALRRQPDYGNALVALARIQMALGDRAGALRTSEHIVRLDKSNTEARDRVAQLSSPAPPSP